MCRYIHRGFTAPELIFTLSTAVLLLGYGLPSVIQLVQSVRLGSITQEFLNHYALARTYAQLSHSAIHLCSRSNNQCSESPQWSEGWIVFMDSDNNKQVDDGEILSLNQGLPDGYRLQPNTNTYHLVFQNDGQVVKINGSLPLTTFRLCSPHVSADTISLFSREIVLNGVGRPRLQHGRPEITECSNIL